MDYAKQQKYLSRSRALACALALLLIAYAAACLRISRAHGTGAVVVFAITIAALAISLWYSPDYLRLTVNSEKTPRWEIKIRWRLIGAVLLLGALLFVFYQFQPAPVFYNRVEWQQHANGTNGIVFRVLEEKHLAMLKDLNSGLNALGDRLSASQAELSERLRNTVSQELIQTRTALATLQLKQAEELSANRETLEAFLRSWKYHNKLQPEQIDFG